MEPYNFLTLHRDEARRQFFAADISRAPFFDPRTKTWIIGNPVDCREIISSDKLIPATYAEDYEALSERFGLDFSSLIFAFHYIPLCLSGERHAHIRMAVGKFLGNRRDVVESRLPEMVARHLARFRREGRIEVMGDIVEPLVHEYTCLIAGIEPEDAKECHRTSQIFDKSSNLNKRKAMEAEVASLRTSIASRSQGASDEEIGLRLAYFILGKDPLKGTLGSSLHRLLTEWAGSPLSEIEFPNYPPETGVPFIERIVIEPFSHGDTSFEPGNRVRILLQSFSHTQSPLGRSNFFGAGSHACLGRPLSLSFWTSVAAYLSASPMRVTVLSHTPRTTDYVFACPDVLSVDVAHA